MSLAEPMVDREENSLLPASRNASLSGKFSSSDDLARTPESTRKQTPNISYRSRRPVMVFTAGAPGAGKTFCLHSLFGLENIEMLDLDKVMPDHPQFNVDSPAELYNSREAYEWANQKVEELFQSLLAKATHGEFPQGKIVCFDGTGTKVERRLRRMWEAKHAGFWITQLVVRVSFDTLLLRNKQRDRTVPEHILRQYVEELDGAVKQTQNEEGLLDEIIEVNNDRNDGLTGRERWGAHYNSVWAVSNKIGKFFGSMSAPKKPRKARL